jgi:hypothetical protein
VVTVDGSVVRAASSIALTASPSAWPGLRLNDRLTEESCPLWLTDRPARSDACDRIQQDELSARRARKHRQRGRVLLKLRRDLQNHLVLVVSA